MYQPLTLPPLPRACPFEVLTPKHTKDGCMMVSRTCNQPAKVLGWCTDHAYVAELLELAVSIGYCEMAVAFVKDRSGKEEPVIIIPRGIACWEAYAVRHPKRRHEALKRKMRVLAASQRGMYAA